MHGTRVLRLLKATVAVLLLGYLVLAIHPDSLLKSIQRANLFFFAAAFLLLFPNIGFQYLKWKLLVKRIDAGVPKRDILASLFSGFTLGILTPARVGEFGGRAVAFRSMNKALLMSLTAVDKFATLLMTLLFGAVASAVFLVRSNLLSPLAAVIACAMFLAAGSAIALLLVRRSFFRATILRRFGQFSFVRALDRSLGSLASFPKVDGLRLLRFSFAFYCVFVGQFVLLLASFGSIGVFSSILGVMTILFVKTVVPPFTIGELGIRESASIFVLSYAGLAQSAAFNASIFLFAINVLLPAVFGLVFILLLPTANRAAH